MSYRAIEISRPTPRVLGKLRKGGKVRICSGTGLSLVVRADRYNPITKSFGKGKAFTMALTPEEINANMNVPEGVEMTGKGLWDDIKSGFKVGAKLLIPTIKGLAKQGVSELAKNAPQLGATIGSSALSGLALMAGQPELVPFAMKAGASLGEKAGKALGGYAESKATRAIDRFDPYNEQRGNAPPSRTPDTNVLSANSVLTAMNSPVGTANIGSYLASLKLGELEGEIARRRGGYSTPYDDSGGRRVLAPYTDAVGRGMKGLSFMDMPIGRQLGGYGSLPPSAYAELAKQGITDEASYNAQFAPRRGKGFGDIRMARRPMGADPATYTPIRLRGGRMGEKGSVGIHGNLLGMGMPPALMSQPFSANFQMASRLPPAFAPIFHSGM